MKTVLLFVAVSCVVAAVYGDLICGSDYCDRNRCVAPVAKTSCRTPSVYRERHAGQCGCCPACVTLLSENQSCKTYSKEHGETPSAICVEPLLCLKGVCTKVKPRQ